MPIASPFIGALVSTVLAQAPVAPDAPWLPDGFHAPRLACAMSLPPGWTTAGPMPDHIAEVWLPRTDGGVPMPGPIVEERPEPTVAAAAKAIRERSRAAWGRHPDYAFVAERPLAGAGVPARIVIDRFRAAAGLPLEDHYYCLLEFGGVVADVMYALPVGADGRVSATEESQLFELVRSLRCAPKPQAHAKDQ